MSKCMPTITKCTDRALRKVRSNQQLTTRNTRRLDEVLIKQNDTVRFKHYLEMTFITALHEFHCDFSDTVNIANVCNK